MPVYGHGQKRIWVSSKNKSN